MDIIKLQSSEEFVQSAVTKIADTIRAAQSTNGIATVGLSGGSTPKPVYQALSQAAGIDWQRVTLFLVDERYISASDVDSNAKMIRETLLQGHATAARFLTPDVSEPLPECITQYDAVVAALLTIDLVVLGMGLDGHIASLFPPVGPKAYGPASVMHTTTDAFAVRDRISVTFPLLKRAEKRLFLITGEPKETLLKKMQRENEDASMYPAQYLFDEKTTWIVGA
jgi:6-phosphogluconolactonase